MDFIAKIKAVQSAVGELPDGRIGPRTVDALYERLVAPNLPVQKATEAIAGVAPVDARSEKAIATLHPRVQPYARALVSSAAAQGITIIITSGTRTYAEQDALFAQPHDGKDNDGDGRIDEPDEKVTNARGGQSNHNFGIAFDVTIFSAGRPVWESPAYKAVGALGKSLGLTWGGDWTTMHDEPHFELRPSWASSLSNSQMLAGLRDRQAAGRDAFAA